MEQAVIRQVVASFAAGSRAAGSRGSLQRRKQALHRRIEVKKAESEVASRRRRRGGK